ncbi:aspartic proteinase CDR1 [Cajanus cajan]|nr:aspartic proteinase CDR1 [Cajanus cajan]
MARRRCWSWRRWCTAEKNEGVLTDEGLKGGFSVELIHRNSPQSPFYDPTETPFQQLHNAFHRSINRVNNFYPKSKASQMTPLSEIIANSGAYLMRYSIGTPPFEVMGFVDTGSDLVWLQCNPCKGCSNQTTPFFDPSKSSTYKPISCDSKECDSLLTSHENLCHSKDDPNCKYRIIYDDQTFTKGTLAFETLTFSSITGWQLHNAFHRSINRVNNFYPKSKASQMTPLSEIIANSGAYLMRYSIGTPPFEVMGFVDTGSDLVWLQCNPCKGCSNQTTPFFDPSKSSTYKPISCDSKECDSLLTSHENLCHSKDDPNCKYRIIYDDQTFTKGTLAFETLTFSSITGSSVAFPKFPIGCDQARKFYSNRFGVVGLGKGGVSLITQMGPSIDFKFSYCLPYFKSKGTSKLNFGINAVVAGPGTVSTPLKQGSLDTLYFLKLEGMSVGSKRIEFVDNSTSIDANGNAVIDSGTTLTFMEDNFYAKLEPEVMAQIKLERVQSPKRYFSLCYKSPANNETGIPFITAHFAGADVVLNPSSTFIEVKDNVICFTIVRLPIPGIIFGNLAQMNYLIGFDLVKKTVSFKPTDCTKM